MENPNFRPIPGYDTMYAVNEDGIIKRLERYTFDKRGRLKHFTEMYIKTYKGRAGYLVVKLTKPDGRHGSQNVHRLVALAHIPNPLNKGFVNHLSGDKMDPRVTNLEWCTRSENQYHAILNNLFKAYYATPVRNSYTNEYYPSKRQAAIAMGIPVSKLSRILRKNTHPCLKTIRADRRRKIR